ncbi:hypothetical protein T440DRAFT_71963 [Plenodomus tracheiphilus IPT5]|uniref:SMP domain-containing protein n=1 Tax=Plenodomus tracheiphilus IPT5 TaxID=1408161 RepID=A0A6A7BA85_9PLEO|nr:hypothetical protein T440DRAFT_71963 [Plenodomus tracheiphilus IPT5]
MPHSKTPGQSNAASDKFNKQDAEAKGVGAANAPGATEQKKAGEAPVASDSGNSNVGVDPSANNPGEKGIGGPNYGTR